VIIRYIGPAPDMEVRVCHSLEARCGPPTSGEVFPVSCQQEWWV
jgi:hypothetical protein